MGKISDKEIFPIQKEMNNIINTLAGGEKAATPTRRIVVIATMITALLVVLAFITLAVSSIIFSISDENSRNTEPADDDFDSDAVPAPVVKLEYTVLEDYDAAAAMFDKLAAGKKIDERTISGNNIYYAYANPSSIKLATGALKAAHTMLLEFTKASKALVTDKNASDCNVPLVDNVTNNGYSFELLIFADSKTTYKDPTYSWIYNNAYRYGFVHTENTFTYVGIGAASYANANANSSLDTLAEPISYKAGGESYQIYFTAEDADEHKVPSNYKYTLTSMNGGYLVTVNMSQKVSAN